MAKIRLFVAEHCLPCESLKEMAQNGALGDDVEIIDIESEEGFNKFNEEILSEEDAEVPSIYSQGGKCEIKYDKDNNIVDIVCPGSEEELPELVKELDKEV